MKKLLLNILFLMLVVYVNAQQSDIQKIFNKAGQYEAAKKIALASKEYLKIAEMSQVSINDYAIAGQFFMQQYQFTNAIIVYKKAYQVYKEKALVIGLPMADALMRMGEFDFARHILLSWDQYFIQKTIVEKEKYTHLKQQIDFLQFQKDKFITDTPANMGGNINGRFDEFGPSINAADSQIVFTRKNYGVDEDFFISQKDTCGIYLLAKEMGTPPNTTKQEGAHFLSADGNYLFFMRCGNQPTNERTMGACDLYFAYRKGNAWAEHVPFGATINTPYFEGMPSLSPDNKKLYFVSDRPGGYGGKDIWVTVFENGYWQVPVNAGPHINTSFDETTPYIANDNQTLYFASNGHAGFGGFDLYVAKADDKSNFNTPLNLGCPINTRYDEQAVFVNAQGKQVYFSSNREEGWGGYDIYEANLPTWALPKPVSYLYGIIVDSISRKELTYAQLFFYDSTGKEISQYQSNAGDASFLASLPIQEDLILKIFRSGYQDLEWSIHLQQSNTKVPDTLIIGLLPKDYEPPRYQYKLELIHFAKNVLTIDTSFIPKLNEQLKPFITDTSSIYTIHSYTDDSGTPLINEDFSNKRALNVMKHLMDLGISPAKIQVRAWADADPLMPNDSDYNRYLNRRILIQIRSLQNYAD